MQRLRQGFVDNYAKVKEAIVQSLSSMNRKTTIISLLVFIALAGCYYHWTWSPILAAFGGDNAIYFFTANLVSPWKESLAVSSYYAQHSQYPPLYPLVLGLLGGGNSILLAHVVTTTFLLVSFLVFYCWLVREKIYPVLALLIVLLFALAPGTYIQALSIHSENLYLLFSLLALFIASTARDSDRALICVAMLVACSMLTRSAGIALLLGFLAWLFLNRIRARYLLTAIALLPVLAWNLFKDQRSESYLDLVKNHFGSNSAVEVVQQFAQQGVFMVDIWKANFTVGEAGSVFLVVFVILSVAGVCLRAWNRQLDGLYGLLYLGLIVFWPYPAESARLLFPLVPVLLLGMFSLTGLPGAEPGAIPGARHAGLLLVTVFIVITLPNTLLSISRFNSPLEEGLKKFRRTYAWQSSNLAVASSGIRSYRAMAQALERAGTVIPEDQCVYSIKPAITGLYSNRISKIPPKPALDDNEFNEAISSGDCQYLVFYSFSSPTFPIAYYPWVRIEDRIKIIEAYYAEKGEGVEPVAVLAKLSSPPDPG